MSGANRNIKARRRTASSALRHQNGLTGENGQNGGNGQNGHNGQSSQRKPRPRAATPTSSAPIAGSGTTATSATSATSATTPESEPVTPVTPVTPEPAPTPADVEAGESAASLADTITSSAEVDTVAPSPEPALVPDASAGESISASTPGSEVDDDLEPALVSKLDERPDASFEMLSVREHAARLSATAWSRVRGLSVEQWLWSAVVALGAVFRFWGIGDKPLHHDESMHAYFSLQFAFNPASYAYDPLLHGPFQFHAEGIMFAILLVLQHIFAPNAAGNPWITDATARIVPVLFGIGIVALPYGLRRDLGRAGALIAAFLLAVSPAFVYFSRFLREDIYFNFFMFAMVVAGIRYAHERTMRRFIQLFAASVLAYATFEGFFLTAAVFGAFLAIVFVWDLGYGISRLLPALFSERERLFFSRAGLLLLLGLVASLLAYSGLHIMSNLNTYITKYPDASLKQVTQLENVTVAVVLYTSIAIALLVIGTLIWQMYRDDAVYQAEHLERAEAGELEDGEVLSDEDLLAAERRLRTISRVDAVVGAPARGLTFLRAQLDARHQPFLALLLSISWVEWFVAFVVGWLIFAALFWIVPGGTSCQTIGQCFQVGVGKGIWQGLYYWIQQQQVARGGQPVYYYFLLIPLYEQLACVFGLIGLVYSLVRPTRFRLFLVWWFVASLGLYSWAGEKMPWLSIHILLPLMLLAGVSLNWVALNLWPVLSGLSQLRLLPSTPPAWATRPALGFIGYDERTGDASVQRETQSPQLGFPTLVRARWRPALALTGALAALALLAPMIHSMLTLSQVDAANGPLEMMVYVQTTPDVDLAMAKIAKADQQLYGGRHQLRIGVGVGEEWPFYWYLRDYPNVYYEYDPTVAGAAQVDVALMMPYDGSGHSDAQSFMAQHSTGYSMKQYKLRSWWDEAYKPEPCIPTKSQACPASSQWGSGVNLGPYLSYGTFANPHAKFDLGRAAGRLWAWLWQRKPLGATGGSYDFVFIVRNGLPIKP